MISRSEKYVSPAREAETIVRRPKMAHFPPYTRGVGKNNKKQAFSTPRTRRRGAAHPRKRIPLHGFGGRSVAPRTRRGEKRTPLRNAREPSRYRAWPNAQNHRKVSRSSTRNSHTLPRKSTTRTPFSPKRMPKRGKGYHFAQATERHRAETTKPCQEPPQAPPRRMPHFPLKKTCPGDGGADPGPCPFPL